MNCFICKLPLVEQLLNKGIPLDKQERKQYKKDMDRENSIRDCEKCKCFVKIKLDADSSVVCKKCGGNYKSLSKRAVFAYHKWMVGRPYYYVALSCPTHGSIII